MELLENMKAHSEAYTFLKSHFSCFKNLEEGAVSLGPSF